VAKTRFIPNHGVIRGWHEFLSSMATEEMCHALAEIATSETREFQPIAKAEEKRVPIND